MLLGEQPTPSSDKEVTRYNPRNNPQDGRENVEKVVGPLAWHQPGKPSPWSDHLGKGKRWVGFADMCTDL